MSDILKFPVKLPDPGNLVELFDKISALQHSNPRAVEALIKKQIEDKIDELSGGDASRFERLSRLQWNIAKELRGYKDPVARMNKMAELFWEGVKDFKDICGARND